MLDLVDTLLTWVSQNQVPALLLPGVVVLLAIVARASRGSASTDPQRTAGFARADGRCEFDGALFFVRCPRDAHHADHFYPWSKGGATSMQNLVAACAACNLSKGPKMLSAFYRKRIERRRRKYFTVGMNRLVGEWYGC
ncbi:HNH endonuclease [Rathayibacter rathayi]|nr:HNH endonuclease [Rathayibacter rathayi]